MKKETAIISLMVIFTLMISLSFASAFSFSDFWGKMTGRVVDASWTSDKAVVVIISSDQSNTVVFAVPIEILRAIDGLKQLTGKK